MAWADSELFHLGPVVVAQQIHARRYSKATFHLAQQVFQGDRSCLEATSSTSLSSEEGLSKGLNSFLSSSTSEEACVKMRGRGWGVRFWPPFHQHFHHHFHHLGPPFVLLRLTHVSTEFNPKSLVSYTPSKLF